MGVNDTFLFVDIVLIKYNMYIGNITILECEGCEGCEGWRCPWIV